MENVLLEKIHGRFKFPGRNDEVLPWEDDNMEGINAKSLNKCSKALRNWKHMVKVEMAKEGSSYDTVKSHFPSIKEEDYLKFKAHCADPKTHARSEYFKGLQKMNVRIPRLGSRGYTGKRPVWDKEDPARPEGPREPDPWEEFDDPHACDYIMARYTRDPITGEWTMDTPTRNVIREMVIFLFTTLISF